MRVPSFKLEVAFAKRATEAKVLPSEAVPEVPDAEPEGKTATALMASLLVPVLRHQHLPRQFSGPIRTRTQTGEQKNAM